MEKQEVRALIEKVGIVPVIRASSAEEAKFAAESVSAGGIPIVEITMTVPGAVEVIAELVKTAPEILVGAGTVLDEAAARKCADAGAKFLVSPGFDAATVAAAREMNLLIMAGALTPTEVMNAWKSGADFVKVFPCGNLGGPNYIKALKGPLPQVPLVPTGGVNLETAADYIRAGAAALGVGGELVQKEALQFRNGELIRGFAKEFVELVKRARNPGTSGSKQTMQAGQVKR
ncbi:MAG TPA: bifunctional 4-hydroxy-2-oxoglutarate aldolase/2-dehydro-3-deoxy-phosphogluconate aldolase [Candidatus Dormibacteraeota bacterium]|nr:bifunctional 4-hydroxy-2-oxoglutarate aldolase/2-dehydro-3-deoxy-phosphogluconate aldolase [Candidatus Dormibacteraeota bacterium]